MKLKVLIFILLSSYCNFSFSCGLFESIFTSEHASLEYVGKITLQEPIKENNVIKVPMSVIGDQWLENSGIGIGKINSKIEKNKIYLTVVTCVGGTENLFIGLTLKNVNSGIYEVFYKNPDKSIIPIGSIKIKQAI